MKSNLSHALTFRQFTGLIALTGLLFGFTGCTSISIQHDLTTVMARLPQPELVGPGQELQTAEKEASKIPGAGALCGTGQSMAPLYAEGTAVVVVPYNFEKLHTGMAVVYWSSRGYRVGHVLIGETRNGFIAQGLN